MFTLKLLYTFKKKKDSPRFNISKTFLRNKRLQHQKRTTLKHQRKMPSYNTAHYTWLYFTRMRVEVTGRGERDRGEESSCVYSRLIYSSLRGRRTIHARQQLLHIILRLLPYSQWMSRDRCCITNNVSVDLHVAWGMCTQRTRGSHYCAAVTAKQRCAFWTSLESSMHIL